MEKVKSYISILRKFGFKQENNQISSIYYTQNFAKYLDDSNVSPYVIVALDKAKHFYVDAVYFRFFDDERPPIAQIYIYDNISNKRNKGDYQNLHRAIWSSGEIPTFFIIDAMSIQIFDARKPIKIEQNKVLSSPIEIIALQNLNDAVHLYNADLFNNGTFWESKENKSHFLYNEVASERLIHGLQKVRMDLYRTNVLPRDSIDPLLIICILIKYLEENGIDKVSGHNLAHSFFYNATGYKHLEEIIIHKKLLQLLDKLAIHFNGGIFSISNKLREELQNTDISELAHFFEAGYKNNLFGWKEYSFEYIPVELISNFYEELLYNKKSTGAVYTPYFLVNLLVDECLPLGLGNTNENVKLIDPACGSGIFLVTAYKRLVQRWRLKHASNGKLADTTPKILKEILIKNIYGIDISKNAVNLTIFSLQLALCSMLTPKQIWTELDHFDSLYNKNIFNKDSFKYIIDDHASKDFDLVIGNPPFIRLGDNDWICYKEILKNKYPIEFINNEKELALLFLEEFMHLLKKEGRLCLILPSGPLLYCDNSSQLFRAGFFNKYRVDQIIDFTYLRRVLFKATVATVAIFVRNISPRENDDILHVVARRTKSSKEKSYFELDYYDFHTIPRDIINSEPNVWKSDLLGGSTFYNLAKKLYNQKRKISDFLLDNNISSSNVKKDSFISSSINNKTQNYKPTLFDNVYVKLDHNANEVTWDISKTLNKFPKEIELRDFNTDNFDGISYRGDQKFIYQLKKYIETNSKLISFYIAVTSGRQGIRSPYVINSNDLNKFPYNEDLKLSAADEIIVSDVYKYALEEFGRGEKASINVKVPSTQDLKEYSEILCKSLNRIYSYREKQYKFSRLIISNAFYLCQYIYTDKDISFESENNDVSLDDLLYSWNFTHTKKINRILRIYQDDRITIIKPKLLRYWLKSKAIIDANDIFSDVISKITCNNL